MLEVEPGDGEDSSDAGIAPTILGALAQPRKPPPDLIRF
jgi:hypothetical protein